MSNLDVQSRQRVGNICPEHAKYSSTTQLTVLQSLMAVSMVALTCDISPSERDKRFSNALR